MNMHLDLIKAIVLAAILVGTLAFDLRSRIGHLEPVSSITKSTVFDRGWIAEYGTLWSVRFGVAKPTKQRLLSAYAS
jgi:hypothetical protein